VLQAGTFPRITFTSFLTCFNMRDFICFSHIFFFVATVTERLCRLPKLLHISFKISARIIHYTNFGTRKLTANFDTSPENNEQHSTSPFICFESFLLVLCFGYLFLFQFFAFYFCRPFLPQPCFFSSLS
jgi:hypothetical protein